MPLPAVFEQYQKARTQFVQMVAELATRPQNIETLQNAGEPSACIRVAPHPGPASPAAPSSPQTSIPSCPRPSSQPRPSPYIPSPFVAQCPLASPQVPVSPLPRWLGCLGASCRAGTDDGVPKFLQSTAEAVEVFGLFCGSLRVKFPDGYERGQAFLFPSLSQLGKCQI